MPFFARILLAAHAVGVGALSVPALRPGTRQGYAVLRELVAAGFDEIDLPLPLVNATRSPLASASKPS
jgi:hypothetical protein|tara:strand:+ start:100 stop:303 length:204 start_codon:yes stop_codon:yes gene_type:complete